VVPSSDRMAQHDGQVVVGPSRIISAMLIAEVTSVLQNRTVSLDEFLRTSLAYEAENSPS